MISRQRDKLAKKAPKLSLVAHFGTAPTLPQNFTSLKALVHMEKLRQQVLKRVFVSDCEGPISKNDNAFEIAENFIPNGDKFFTNISLYDDVLADALKKPGYSAGSTLKLILPFFKAYGVTDSQMEDFSAKNILLIANSKATLRHIQAIADTFIVSTSYEHYIRALCNTVVSHTRTHTAPK